MRKRRGMVMVLTIVVLAATTALLASALARDYAEFRAVLNRIEGAKAQLAAKAGIQYALASMQTQTTDSVTQMDTWYDLGSQSTERFLLNGGSFRFQIADASSLVNLNTATEDQLQTMGLTTEQIDSLLDWREEGQTPRVEGAKDDFYNTLENPYNTKLRRLDSLDELLLVKGFDATTLFTSPEMSTSTGYTPRPLSAIATVDSFSPSAGIGGEQKQNINSASQEQLQQAGIPPLVAAAIIVRRNQGQFTSIGDVLRVPGMTNQAATSVVDAFMVGAQPRDEGRINVNTASEDVLLTLPDMTSDVAQAIISLQSAGMMSLGELLQVPGITLPFFSSFVDRLTTTSEVFLVRVEGMAGTSRWPMEAVLRLNEGRAIITKIYDSPQNDMVALWGWPDETTTETDLGETR